MTTDYRALCAELTETLSKYQDRLEETYHPDRPEAKELDAGFRVLERARTLLAQPEPVGPTDEELHQLWLELYAFHDGPTSGDVAEIARAVLQRWGGASFTPIPSGETTPMRTVEHGGRSYLVPESASPTDEELVALAEELDDLPVLAAFAFARAVLARWGRPAITPIPVSERLPEAHDLSPCEPRICWCWDEPEGSWRLATSDYLSSGDLWLPYSAITDASAGQPAPTAPAP